jgi:hypothetical protein
METENNVVAYPDVLRLQEMIYEICIKNGPKLRLTADKCGM